MTFSKSKFFSLTLFLLSSTLSQAGTTFTITATSNSTINGVPSSGTSLGYTNGASYSFVFETGSSFINTNPLSSFSPSNINWIEGSNGDDQLWSSVGGSGVNGSFIPPATSDSYNLVVNNSSGTRSLQGAFSTTGNPPPGFGLFALSGDKLLNLGFLLDNVANFTFGGTYIQPNEYFASYYGTYASTGTIYFNTQQKSHNFTVTSVTIGGSSVPDASSTLVLVALSAMTIVAFRRRGSLL